VLSSRTFLSTVLFSDAVVEVLDCIPAMLEGEVVILTVERLVVLVMALPRLHRRGGENDVGCWTSTFGW
jgi:hypothetical protein